MNRTAGKLRWAPKRARGASRSPRCAIDAGTGPTARVGLRVSPLRARNAVAVVVAAALLSSCVWLPRSAPVDPGVDFAAHLGVSGIVVDRMEGGRTAVLVHPHSSPSPGGPTYLLQADGKTIAALWVTGSDQVSVRQTVDPTGPVIGHVRAAWEHGAIRLTLESADGASVRTGVFDRSDVHFQPNALGKEMLSVHDLPGVYRAELRDPQNVNVGWLRVRLSQYMATSHTYDGVLPTPLNGPLAAGAVLLLESQVDNVEQSALDTWWSD